MDIKAGLCWREDSSSPTPTVVSDTSSMLGGSCNESVGSGSSSASIVSSDDLPMVTPPPPPVMIGGSSVGGPQNTVVTGHPYMAAASLMTTFLLGNLGINGVAGGPGNGNNSNHHRKLNRSQSEPSRNRYSSQSQQQQPQVGNVSRYKTELCHPFEENGSCKYGDKCQFAHGVHELRDLARHPKYKTELCRTFHADGYCPYGARCHFVHDESRYVKPRPRPLCLFPNQLVSSNSVKDLSPSSLSSLSPASVTSSTAFPFGPTPTTPAPVVQLSPVCSPPSSPSPVVDTRLPVFDRLSSPILTTFPTHFGDLTV